MEGTRIISPDRAHMPAIVVGLQKTQDSQDLMEGLYELSCLLKTLGIDTAATLVQKQRQRLSPSHLLGTGKVEEICRLVDEKKAGLVVIDHPLSGPQVRNLEKITHCQVLDRSAVILDIFARHAHTNQAKTQVEIAQLEYLLPRLSGAWTHFQRQTGGGVHARGMGEKQIEVDRRRARERISRLKGRLEQISKERAEQRKKRQNELKVALVGYTNCGKTTLMSALTRSTVMGKDELFATLDSSIRVLDPTTRPKLLLSDTVGFVKQLPHSLVASFKSTLEEVVSADLLLLVVDISHPHYQAQLETTAQVLQEIGADNIPVIHVFNKIDAVEEKFLPRILQRKYPQSMVISALKQEDITRLRDHVFDFFMQRFKLMDLVVPASAKAPLSLIYQSCVILSEEYNDTGVVHFKVRAPEQVFNQLKDYEEHDHG